MGKSITAWLVLQRVFSVGFLLVGCVALSKNVTVTCSASYLGRNNSCRCQGSSCGTGSGSLKHIKKTLLSGVKR